MRILIAPDKFKDCLSAEAAAAAMARGVAEGVPQASIELSPLADGGEGSGPILARALGADARSAAVLDPLRRPRLARWWQTPDRAVGIVEMAEASGLHLLSEPQRNPLWTTSFGTGQLIAAAAASGCSRVMVCVGGSATVDGGAGCLQALGWKLLGNSGNLLPPAITGQQLMEVARVEPPQNPLHVELKVLCDVTNPLLGPDGAAPVFGPQKGAAHHEIGLLERGLTNWAAVLAQAAGVKVDELPRGGAAGGIAAGLAGALGATLVGGFDEIAEQADVKSKLGKADLCLTGEGRIDRQTLRGKVVAGLARLAASAHVPVIAFVGKAEARPEESTGDLARDIGLAAIIEIASPQNSLHEALRSAEHLLSSSIAARLPALVGDLGNSSNQP